MYVALRKFSHFWYTKPSERNGTSDIALTAVTSKEDMYDDKGEGEETRAVLPSSHSWRAPTPIHRLSLPPFVRFILTERASACVRACVYEGARVLARASCLRAFVWGMCVRVYTREESRFCTRTRLCVCVLARGTGICSPRFFFFLPFDSGGSSRLSSRVCLSPCRKGDAWGSAIGR